MNTSGRVLLADDEDLFRDTTADLLRKSGYTVDCASDAAEAARMLAAEHYDVLISDIKMPGNAELELVLKVNELARGLPIILVTGYPAIETAVRAVEHAVVAYLIKPVHMDELLGSRQGGGCQESPVPDGHRSAKANDGLGAAIW